MQRVQDVKILKRRRWQYLILDEAHMIKNWKSQRWQALLNFSARHRLLITGPPSPLDRTGCSYSCPSGRFRKHGRCFDSLTA